MDALDAGGLGLKPIRARFLLAPGVGGVFTCSCWVWSGSLMADRPRAAHFGRAPARITLEAPRAPRKPPQEAPTRAKHHIYEATLPSKRSGLRERVYGANIRSRNTEPLSSCFVDCATEHTTRPDHRQDLRRRTGAARGARGFSWWAARRTRPGGGRASRPGACADSHPGGGRARAAGA